MSITAKEIASLLHLSQTAVSMALNNKPGVSRETRELVIRTAEENGYDFSRRNLSATHSGSIYVIFYRTHNAIMSYTPIFEELLSGIKEECQKEHFSVKMIHFYEKTDDLETCFADLRTSDCAGIILVGTEIDRPACQKFIDLGFPLILLDSYFESLNCSSVLINNRQGAYLATDYLISITHSQPGYLKSDYSIPNFDERQDGYYQAIRENGMSRSACIIHRLSPSIENAMSDMLQILDDHVPLARCYFADNDILAIGAMKAFKLRGYRIPDDISIIGFDNISEARIVDPSLTTMDVPRSYIGQIAAERLIKQIDSGSFHAVKIEIGTRLVKRLSHSM